MFNDLREYAINYLNPKFEHMKILKKLIELGANINPRDTSGYNPLHHCLTTYGNKTTMIMAKELLVVGANHNQQNRGGRSPLFDCVDGARVEFVALLLEYGADIDLKNNE